MTWAVWINETDVSTLGFYVEQVGGWLHGPKRSYSTMRIPGRMGAVLPSDPEIQPRALRLIGSIRTAANTIAARADAEKQLKALAYRGLVRITIDDDINPPLSIDGVLDDAVMEPKAHPLTTPVSKCELGFLCPDPSFYETQPALVSCGSTATGYGIPIPMGNAPCSHAVLYLAAPDWSADVTNPQVQGFTAGGQSLGVLSFNGLTLVKGQDHLEIDFDRSTIVLSDAGVRSNGMSLLEVGATFFALDPLDGDYTQSAWPRLKVWGTAGNASGLLSYRKRWL